MTRQRKPQVWPWARDNMSPDERREVIEYGYAHPGVVITVGYSPRERRYFAEVGDRRETHPASPIEAFRSAASPRVAIVSVLS